ncbi:MAG: hypothetical protein ABH857_01215 [Elusimicrobiota bacterium]
MKKVLLINKGRAYLPEIQAYKKYFNDNINFNFYDSQDISDYNQNEFDILWYFMGIDTANHNKIVVHEYGSLSAGVFPRLKNNIKKVINKKPDLRIFLNNAVKNGFNFSDDVPFCMRDMGVDDIFYAESGDKEYDFVYIGQITRERQIDKLLDVFKNKLKNKTILLIGSVEDELKKAYSCDNIIYFGRLPYYDIPIIASKARYGINFVPDKYPYNKQTSTKLLEYCAMNLNIITLSCDWSLKFEKQHNAAFYNLTNDLSNFAMNEIEDFEYKTPDISDLTWTNIIKNSGIEEALRKLV